MRVGFDAKCAAQNRTGLGNYSRYVLRILSQQNAESDYHLYIPNQKCIPYLAEIPTLDKLHLHFPFNWLWRRLCGLWRVWGMTKDIKTDNIDVFHGLSNELPLNIADSGVKSIVTIHDVIFKHYPQYYNCIDRKIYDYKFRRACINASHVIAVSQYTKQEIIRYYGIDGEKISVAYQGCDTAYTQDIAPEKLAEVKKRYNLPDKFLLYVGSIEERKNLLLAVKALRLIDENIKLVAVGKTAPYVETIKRYIKYSGKKGLADDVIFMHNVPFADLPSFYRLATTFVYPSRIEGFGIPLLEAITSGVPAIGCTGSCLEEAGGPGSIYVAPDDQEAMAQAILRTFHDENLRNSMINMGKTYAKRFSDHLLCQDIIHIYNKVLEKNK